MTTRRTKITVFVTTVFIALMVLASPTQASTLGLTWNHTAGHAPYVMVEDHTGSTWPVTAGVSKWNYGLHYGRCTNSQCVRVYEANWGRNGTVAKTTITSYNGHFLKATIQMNNAYSYLSYANRLQAATHELGHSLGLDHDPYADVMHSPLCSCTTVSTYERNELAYLYR